MLIDRLSFAKRAISAVAGTASEALKQLDIKHTTAVSFIRHVRDFTSDVFPDVAELPKVIVGTSTWALQDHTLIIKDVKIGKEYIFLDNNGEEKLRFHWTTHCPESVNLRRASEDIQKVDINELISIRKQLNASAIEANAAMEPPKRVTSTTR